MGLTLQKGFKDPFTKTLYLGLFLPQLKCSTEGSPLLPEFNSSKTAMEGAKREEIEVKQRDWTRLPNDILVLIVSGVSLTDSFRFGSVCTPWRHASMVKHRLPWLMLSKSRVTKTRGFFCLQNSKFYQLPLPKVVRRSWWGGSSHGWLIMAHKTRGDFLFNPFSECSDFAANPP
ncbi:hypothetical protein L1049_004696 [Liquidambar formosana]|uniref:F-box domain-containing protein n=1 Tax=Liquidambar formosana TaxID=63359 RepID=A0AAP0RPN5_LIQFO